MAPYYETKLGKLYHGDCLEIMPELEPVDLVLTDPPYEGYSQFEYVDLRTIPFPKCRMLIFYKSKNEFPLSYSTKHKWFKGNSHNSYEHIYEINSFSKEKEYRIGCINSVVSASMLGDCYTKHPTQKPLKLLIEILKDQPELFILDCFLGSGTTAVACERLKRKWIGIEIEEKYCEIAAKRIEENLTVMERIERCKKGITKKTGLLF